MAGMVVRVIVFDDDRPEVHQGGLMREAVAEEDLRSRTCGVTQDRKEQMVRPEMFIAAKPRLSARLGY